MTVEGHWPTELGRHWILGLLGSQIIVWLVGPWLVDSILVRVVDPALEVTVLRPGDLIRWRSEGWGNTRIGPHGLPGWNPRVAEQRIVLWGDSQVEGVCVDDPEKISNQVIALAHQRGVTPLDCLPMGHSGADARDWRELSEAADSLWHPLLHVWVVTDLSDLTALAPLGEIPPERRWPVKSPRWVKWAAALRADAPMAAAKRVFRDPETGGIRRLDFGLGPRRSTTGDWGLDAATDSQPSDPARDDAHAIAVAREVADMAQRLGGRFALLYAPAMPTLGRPLVTEHPDDALFARIAPRIRQADIAVVDLREDFVNLWHSHQRLPRGFHNGQPGYGHLNAVGNRLVAQAVLALVQE